MKVVSLASVRGAPGVTTTAILLASTFTDGLLVEADLDGGVLAVRYGLGREPGLTTFAAGGPDADGGWRAHAQDAGGVPVLVGPDAPGASTSMWRTAGERITHKLVAADGVVVVDAGRLRSPVPIVAASDLLAVLANPVADQLVALTHLVPTLRQEVRGGWRLCSSVTAPTGWATSSGPSECRSSVNCRTTPMPRKRCGWAAPVPVWPVPASPVRWVPLAAS
ncbi:MAG: hypothetical protein M5T61_20645 [Acidimicrobiia bacterium]|nr:hypothetical protein [Acidimicrobiia bacterium]